MVVAIYLTKKKNKEQRVIAQAANSIAPFFIIFTFLPF